jgi:hypothetical protein
MSELNPAEIRALNEALDDEYRAWATYDQVLADFGAVRPFSNIRDAEARHIDALLRLFERYEVAIPQNPWPGRVPRYDSVQAACAAGVAAEIANRDLYQRLMQATERADLLRVFGNLQAASEERHLPAFQRGAARPRGGRGQR